MRACAKSRGRSLLFLAISQMTPSTEYPTREDRVSLRYFSARLLPTRIFPYAVAPGMSILIHRATCCPKRSISGVQIAPSGNGSWSGRCCFVLPSVVMFSSTRERSDVEGGVHTERTSPECCLTRQGTQASKCYDQRRLPPFREQYLAPCSQEDYLLQPVTMEMELTGRPAATAQLRLPQRTLPPTTHIPLLVVLRLRLPADVGIRRYG